MARGRQHGIIRCSAQWTSCRYRHDVHNLRNLERKAPKHVLDGLRAGFQRIVYAKSAETARTAWTAFERLKEEFRRRVKMHFALPTEDSALHSCPN
jgi:transposase-like protein